MTNLKSFVSTKMKMTAIYQPVIIKVLLENNGSASYSTIADELVKLDSSKPHSFYIDRLAVHPRTVLATHEVASVEKKVYKLEASYTDANEIILILNNKIAQFMSK